MPHIRPATAADTALILQLIRELAEYEKLLHEVVATEEILHQTLFGDQPKAYTIILEENGQAAGFALYFYNFSTFLGRPGIYLEDLYVRPAFRGKGYGKALLQWLAAKALDEGCGRLEWWVLDWNAPSIAFYESLGAEAMDEWTVYRLSGDALTSLAGA